MNCIHHTLRIVDYDKKYVILGCEDCDGAWTYYAVAERTPDGVTVTDSMVVEYTDDNGRRRYERLPK